MSACIDCGTSTTDGPMCSPCAEVAGALLGGVDARIAILSSVTGELPVNPTDVTHPSKDLPRPTPARLRAS